MNRLPRQSHYEVIIVGSGVAGALVAKQLGAAKKNVLVLEAGAPPPPNFNEYVRRFYMSSTKVPESPYSPEIVTDLNGKLILTDPATLNAGRPTSLALAPKVWRDPIQSYLIQDGVLPFSSTYERIAGGTAMHWLGTSLRLLPSDFQMQALYDRFVNWPITYAELEPWYHLAEEELGVSASTDEQGYHGLKFSCEYPMPPIPKSLVDQAVATGIDGMILDGVPLSRCSVRSTPAARNSQPYQNRRVCAGNTNCIPICPIQAKYDPTVTLNAAQSTGFVEFCYQTVVTELIVDPSGGRIKEVAYKQYDQAVGGPTSERRTVSADTYVIAANAIETPRLLLMSTNEGRTSNGVANRSKQVGKNLMDHPFYVAWGRLKDPAYPYRGPLSTSGIEELRDGAFRRDRAAYRIEIGNEGWRLATDGDPNMLALDFINGLNNSRTNREKAALFGDHLVDRLNEIMTRQLRLGFLVEQSPEERNRVELARDQLDHLGLPRPKITYDLSDYTKTGLAFAKRAANQIFTKLGDEYTIEPKADDPSAFDWQLEGKSIRLNYLGAGHIMGTYRMGFTREESVVKCDQCSWDHDNLYLIGSGTFPTSATANPTLTLAALALRTSATINKMTTSCRNAVTPG